MLNTTSKYSLLIEKLDQFIRKYYLNQLIKGSLYTLATVLILFISFNLLEYFFYFGTSVRKFIFYSFLLTVVGIGIYFILIPLFHYFKLGKLISHEEASKIIGEHFTDVKDKLLNVLHLKKQEESSTNKELLFASIEQKTEAIQIVPFKSAIDLSNNRKYLKYALPPFFLLIFLLLAAPSIIKDSTYRIINNNKDFAKAAPFQFIIDKEKLEVAQFEDFPLNIKVEGISLPNEIYVSIDGFHYKADKLSNNEFTFLFRNVQKNTNFNIIAGTVSGETNTLEVIAKPNIADFKVTLNYPNYTGRKKEVLDNIGDMIVPEGTVATWSLNTLNTNTVAFKFDNLTPVVSNQNEENVFGFKKSLVKDHIYQMLISNKRLPVPDSIQYAIQVVKDQYPTIAVEEFRDSVDNSNIYFAGSATDDYGINNLTFHYTIVKGNGKALSEQILKLNKPVGNDFQFEYAINVKELKLEAGDNMSYYFQVADNDAINGSKKTKSGVMAFAKPSYEELKELEDKNEEEIKDNLSESLKELEKIQEKYKKLREKLLQEKELDFQSKKELEKLLDQQKEVEKKLEEAKKKMQENLKNQEELQEPDPEVQEKQERMQELMEEASKSEEQELMEKIQELMQELEKDDALQMMEQFEMQNENKNKDMKRLLELYKQLEMEKEVKEQINKLEELAEKQEELAKKTEEEKEKKEDLAKEQEKLNKEMEDIEKKQEELEKKNEELTPPKELGEDNEEKMDDIKEDMKESSKEMQKKESDSKKAAKSQKQASKKMKKMAQDMQSSMDSGEQEQQAEDIKTIRQLLENLVTLSFDQEGLVKDFGNTAPTTPRYVNLVKEQFKIQSDFSVVEDSLTALSLRQDKLSSFITEKVTEIKYNLKSSIDQLEERQVPKGIESQRKTMTNMNDLALILSESMQNMQQQMSGGMPGSQMCQNPGGKGGSKPGKVPMDKISEGQQGLNKDMEGLGDKMKQGKEGSAKDFAQAAARQAALRKALQDMQKQRQEQGKGTDNNLQEIINQMDKVEVELVNKKLNAETLKRQQNILTRLLEAEKAERQREQDEKRKSETADDTKKTMPPALQEYLKKRNAEAEMYKTVSPSLNAHFKNLVNEYYKALKI